MHIRGSVKAKKKVRVDHCEYISQWKKEEKNMNEKLGGYAVEMPDGRGIAFNGGVRHLHIVIPKYEVTELVAEFNENVWEGIEQITLRQITGSAGPCRDFVKFYVDKWTL